jgi:mevalonate kinase
LLTGEYLVLKGAYALALPLKLGQSLFLSDGAIPGIISWKTTIEGKEWFFAEFESNTFRVLNSNIPASAEFISGILKSAKILNKKFLKGIDFIDVLANLEFDINFGFGSSSSLISNIAQWAEVNAFILHKTVSRGSGYDIAAARSNSPIVYHRNETDISIRKVNFKPVFRDRVYFGYLGKKLETESNINSFLNEKVENYESLKAISDITNKITECENIEEFILLVAEHEKLISDILGIQPIKAIRFTDFKGQVKSLGAWGGDFALFVSTEHPDYISQYLQYKGINHFFKYDDLIL